jgi:hypothetical protein
MRYILLFLIGVALVTDCGKLATASDLSSWTPPPSPDAKVILREAKSDAKAGSYTNALAKYVWFYKNALKYDPGMRGVRVSFALNYWAKLGESFPPALEQLNTVRDEAAENVRQGKDTISAFQDFVAINAALKQDTNTSDFFAWLDVNKPDAARVVFDQSQNWLLPALVRTKKYGVCGKYVDPDNSFWESLQLYRTLLEQSNQHHVGSKLKDFADHDFINKTTTLIAVLVIDGRKTDAQQLVDNIAKEPNLPEFKAEIQKALNGDVPEQFP